jgi:hypothetical protein
MTYVLLKNNVRRNSTPGGTTGEITEKKELRGSTGAIWRTLLLSKICVIRLSFLRWFRISKHFVCKWKSNAKKRRSFHQNLVFLVFDHFRLFWIFRPEKSFQKNEEHIFVISSNFSIEWCIKQIENKFHGKSAYCAPYEKPMLSFWKPYLRKSSLPPRRRTYFSIDLLLLYQMWYLTMFRVLC